jgi:hypothetical protein
MTRVEILQQAAVKLQEAREKFTGEGIDCGTPFLLAKYQIEKERDALLQKFRHDPYVGREVEHHCSEL